MYSPLHFAFEQEVFSPANFLSYHTPVGTIRVVVLFIAAASVFLFLQKKEMASEERLASEDEVNGDFMLNAMITAR